jgi:hypothetical protein
MAASSQGDFIADVKDALERERVSKNPGLAEPEARARRPPDSRRDADATWIEDARTKSRSFTSLRMTRL